MNRFYRFISGAAARAALHFYDSSAFLFPCTFASGKVIILASGKTRLLESSKLPKREKDYDDVLYLQRTYACMDLIGRRSDYAREDQVRRHQTDRDDTTPPTERGISNWRRIFSGICESSEVGVFDKTSMLMNIGSFEQPTI
ncbi:hypothetical protein RB195_015489 [Necator americanus]|uniref:Uncharacterized protein n=1 Tax=Necator americanus TaxID=51031 RepID=A0ABR1E635_NECAM